MVGLAGLQCEAVGHCDGAVEVLEGVVKVHSHHRLLARGIMI